MPRRAASAGSGSGGGSGGIAASVGRPVVGLVGAVASGRASSGSPVVAIGLAGVGLVVPAVVDAVVVDRLVVLEDPVVRVRRSSSGAGGSPQRSPSAAPGRWRMASTTSDPTITSAEMIDGGRDPEHVQLPVRSVSSANRTAAYQIRKIRNRSPGRIRAPHRRAMYRSVTAPMIPLTDSYRNSGWKHVVSNGYVVHGYAMTRWSQSMAMPHGRFVGGPYSSWLKKFPQRPMACITKMPGAMTSAHFQNDCFQSRRIIARGDDPGQDPAVHAEARVRRHDDREQVVLVALPLVDDVVQPAADQGRDRDDDDPVVDEPGIQARAGAPRG